MAVNKRFQDIDANPLYCTATILDPCFKEHYFDAEKKQRVLEMVQTEPAALETGGERQSAMGNVEQSMPEKRPRTSDEVHIPSLSDMFDEILQESIPTHSGVRASAASQQLETYLAELPIARSDNPLDYWRFPLIAWTARRYLSA